jgi:tyrosine-specific transport protein
MNMKLVGAVCLVSGTAIGAGMIALPITLAKLGFVPTLLLMAGVWAMMYYSALVNLELNLRVESGKTLDTLGKLYGGRIAQAIGSISLVVLMYSLMSAYLYGGASIIKALLENMRGTSYEMPSIICIYTCIAALVLAFSLKYVERFNRILFITLLVAIGGMILFFLSHADFVSLPIIEMPASEMSSWTVALPTVFTSFGFQVIFHTLTNYCEKNPIVLKRAFFWGSFIPLVVYLVWTLSILSILHANNQDMYHKMVMGHVEVGQLIEALSQVTNWAYIQVLAWVISMLAIITSLIGVSVGMIDMWKHKLIRHSQGVHWKALGLALVPPFMVAILIPNAFIKALSFAGMILAIIALLLPLYLLERSNQKHKSYYYSLLKSQTLKILGWVLGILMIGAELLNMIQA